MKPNKQQIIAFTAGITICLLILEISLRIVGSIYANLSETDTSTKNETSTTILCIGDSFTFGIGASMDLSYPAQLEQMLNESPGGKHISVINRGWPGQNSSQFLLRLEKYLKEFRPDIVTILIGGQNLGNYFGYQDYLLNSHEQKRSVMMVLNDSLEHIRIYKFVRLLFRDSRSNWSGDEYTEEQKPARVVNQNMDNQDNVPECMTGLEQKEKGNYDKALELILGAAQSKDIGAECSNIVGSIYKERKQFDQAMVWFRKGIQYDPTQFKNYEDIGQSYFDQKQPEEAISWFKKGFENANYASLHPRCYWGIGLAFTALNDTKGALAFFESETKREPVADDYLHNLAEDYLALFKASQKNEAVYSWLRSDLEKMLNLCMQYNAEPILQTYPFMPEINFIYKQLAEETKIRIVDHQKAFERFTRNGTLSDDYFIPDGHPNARGYQLMAESIRNTLKKDFSIDK